MSKPEYKGWSSSQWNALVPASYSKIRYLFILQSLTTSKMRKFQTLKLSQLHKEKTCLTENWWSSGIMSNFLGEFFYVLGGKKFFKKFFKNILATALKSYIKWLLYIFFSFLKKFEKVEKTGIISTKFSLRCTYSICYTRVRTNCSSNLKIFENSRPSVLNFKAF